MKRFKSKSIRIRLTSWFFLLTLIPLLIVLTITYFQRVNVIESRTFDKLIAIRDLKINRLNDWLLERRGDMYTISLDNEFTELEPVINKTTYNQNDIWILQNCRRILNRYFNNYTAYLDLFIINPRDGKILLSTQINMEGIDNSASDYFTEPMKTRELCRKDIYYSRTLSRNTMTYSVPIFSNSQTGKPIIGILVARVDLHNTLYEMLRDPIGLGQTGETLIVNKDVFALNGLRWDENAPLKLKITSVPAVNAAEGQAGIAVTTDYRNEKIMAAYAYIPQTGWGFVCKQDLYELNAPIREMIWNFILIFIIVSFIISLLALSISKTISSPIINMNIIAQKIGAGDYSARNTINLDDELGSLAREFNKMADETESRMKIQKNVAIISETMIGESSLKKFGSKLLEQLMAISDANMSTFYVLNENTSKFEIFASIGANKELLKPFNAKNPEGEMGNAISVKRIYYLRDIPEDTIFKYKTTSGDAIPREIITIPILVEGTVLAIISLINVKKFYRECYDILQLAWPGINTSYSNLIASERTRILAEQLTTINQNLEAQTEELQEQSEEMQEQTEELQRTSEELQDQNIELESQKIQVEEANKLKSEFLSNMSHELRTPLNSIMALSRVLIDQAKDKLNAEENNYLEIVERNGKLLLSLINDILDLSKIEAGKMEIYTSSVSIGTLLQNIKDNMQVLANERGLEITLSVPESMPHVETDESKIHQVLTNIIGNALKFTEKGKVDISVKHDSKNVFIEVKDSGIGISKKALPNIFEEFRQADGTTSRQYEGTGLGLAIAGKLIKILNGNVTIKSKLGKGSVFTVSIPFKWKRRLISNEKIDLKDIKSQSTNKTVPGVDDNSEKRILIVEDNQDAVIQIKMVLENENYQVDLAGGGQEALDYVQHTVPDGIILDLMMPDIDGFEVLEKLRETKKTRNIPVLILTAKDLSQKDRTKLSSNNIRQLIFKGDVDIEGLLFKVKLMLENKLKDALPADMQNGEEPVQRKSLSTTDNKTIETVYGGNYITNTIWPNILIIEDNPDNMTTIKALLKGRFNCFEAFDGQQGLKLAKSQLPDLILLDMSLPKLSGEEIIKILKADSATKNIPVLAVTAMAMMGDKERILNLGSDGYSSKPIESKALLAEIDRLLVR